MSDQDDDLIGFKDFLEQERKKSEIKGPPRNRTDGFELLTFLEQDSIRIEKLIKIFEEKSYVLKNYPQAKSVLADISTHRDLLRQQLIETLAQKSSHLFQNLAEIFDKHYTQ